MKTPITIFVYARLEHTQRTISALLSNNGAKDHDLIVFSDAPRTPDKAQTVEAVRNYLNSISGFRSITIHKRQNNYGLARSIIEGVSEVLEQYERIIVLEDDLVTSPRFLEYMNQALEIFADNDRVISVHGYSYPVIQSLPKAFFLRGADCWGWATWRRGWKLFNPNGRMLLDELESRNLLNEFDFNGAYAYSDMLRSQIIGTNDSWAIRWYASAFLADKLTLYPGKSLVQNIGNDSTGEHCRFNSFHDVELSSTSIDLTNLIVQPSELGRIAFENFFRQTRPTLQSRFCRFVKKTINKIFL